jgi:hypothetical protein
MASSDQRCIATLAGKSAPQRFNLSVTILTWRGVLHRYAMTKLLAAWPVDLDAAIGDVAALGFGVWGIAMRSRMAAMGFAVATAYLPMAQQAQAQAVPPHTRLSQAMPHAISELSAQNRRPRPRVRIYRPDDRGVYPSYNPGPDAVRDCTATYVQEHRPSGTVIVPRMNCFWRRG